MLEKQPSYFLSYKLIVTAYFWFLCMHAKSNHSKFVVGSLNAPTNEQTKSGQTGDIVPTGWEGPCQYSQGGIKQTFKEIH
jgi:hypothetical protein